MYNQIPILRLKNSFQMMDKSNFFKGLSAWQLPVHTYNNSILKSVFSDQALSSGCASRFFILEEKVLVIWVCSYRLVPSSCTGLSFNCVHHFSDSNTGHFLTQSQSLTFKLPLLVCLCLDFSCLVLMSFSSETEKVA